MAGFVDAHDETRVLCGAQEAMLLDQMEAMHGEMHADDDIDADIDDGAGLDAAAAAAADGADGVESEIDSEEEEMMHVDDAEDEFGEEELGMGYRSEVRASSACMRCDVYMCVHCVRNICDGVFKRRPTSIAPRRNVSL